MKLLALLLLIVFLTGCGGVQAFDSSTDKLDELEKRIIEIEDRLSKIESELGISSLFPRPRDKTLEDRVSELEEQLKEDKRLRYQTPSLPSKPKLLP